MLDRYVFARVIQVKYIGASTDRGAHFYGKAIFIEASFHSTSRGKRGRGSDTRRKSGPRVFYFERRGQTNSFDVGPATAEGVSATPQIGDTLVGVAIPNYHPKSPLSEKLETWINGATALFHFTRIVRYGTAERSNAIRSKLRQPAARAAKDDLWVLARIVLFGDLECIADAIRGKTVFDLGCGDARVFLQNTALYFDAGLLDRYNDAFPDACVSATVPDRPPPRSPAYAPVSPVFQDESELCLTEAASSAGAGAANPWSMPAICSSGTGEYDPSNPDHTKVITTSLEALKGVLDF